MASHASPFDFTDTTRCRGCFAPIVLPADGGAGGVLLIVIAARYEKQLRALRTAYSAVTSLR
ncbi:hypothetical protein [Microbacterium telephonicum]|uniref:Uncharacterized protein n=1 Tax=Microbacterium telephonicum TaxID=1714841 RepID=A0A498C9W5_9MICO|nr:hypothetical protein [Microbacterium telephonicum]RLK52097.1 hypothetical protein C7474_0023 [Microbacterium telephonicum]